MAKGDAQKKSRVMAKEWWKSRSNEQTIEDLVAMGVLHNKALAGWRAPVGESFPDPQPGEIVVFEDFFKRGFGIPVHPFLQGLCLYYEIGICNLHPNSILLVSTFIHLCEAYGGFQPHFDLFRHLFCLRKKGSGGSKIAGGVYLNLRDGMKAQYLHCPWNTSLDEWYKKWFYIREEPNTITLCDVGLIPEKKSSWSEKPENLEQIAELLGMIPWGRLDGPSVVGNFISRRIQPCQKRIHPGYEYQGSADPTRTRKEPLDKVEIKARIGELFNLADPNYVALDAIEHAFKLARPPPKCNGRDRAGVFVSPPPGVEWPQATGPAAQTSARTDDVHWAVLETVEDASTRAAGKRPAASKRRQAIFPLSDDEAEDADILRLVPRKRRKQVGPSEQGGSSVPAVVTAPTTATQSIDEGNMPHHTPTPVPEVAQAPVDTAEQAEQGRSRRRSFATSFRKSKLSASTESPDQLAGCGTSLPTTAGQTAQQPAVEEPMAGTPPGPQQADDQTPVPEQNTSARSTNTDEADTTAPRELDLTEGQQPEVARNMVADATARGKALVSVESANPGPVPPPEQETEEDEVEEVLGRPQDRRQHVYVSRYRNDEWVMHEEIPEIEETIRVERAAKRLVTEVQDLMKTARYRKRCFDQIEGIMMTNKELTAEVDRLRRQLEAADQERKDQEAQNQSLVGQLENKEQEKTGLEAEVTRLQGENSRALAECGRLKEDNEKLARRQSELQDHTDRMKDNLKVLKVNAKRHLEAAIKERDDWKAQCLKATEERDMWSKRCQEMATGIVPVLDLIDPALTEVELRTRQLGLVERCKQAWGWFQDFVKEAGEYTGAHVLSMVRAHYPLINLERLEAGYPKEIDPNKAEELRTAQLELSSKIIGDISLCGGGTSPVQGMPSTSQLEMPSAASQPTKPAVSTSQAPAGPSPSA